MTDIQTAAVAAPDPIDVAIGSRLRLRRLAMGFSQETLARALGITFQQIQKYERGTNRIFASRLFHLARVLRVPVAYFFHGLQAGGETKAAQGGAPADAADEGVGDLFGRNDSLKLIQAFNRITDPSVRRQVYALVRTVGEQDSPAERSHHDRVGGRRLPEPAK
ncbi:MAG TPA: helix-turn-helix transcriptional regulator [Kiloniellaceae bacterium]